MTDDGSHGLEIPTPVRAVFVLVLLYVFLVGVGMLEGGIAQLGEGFTDGLLERVRHPVAGLFAGILATVLVQSSSVSTSTIVGLVGAGTLPVELAVPMVMGANIGTTVTNTVVSLGSIRRGEEFRRAFAAATMHDFFNFFAVALLFPLELLTGVLSGAARWGGTELADLGVVGTETRSPIREAVKAGSGLVESLLGTALPSGGVLGAAMLLVGLALILVGLRFITTNMRQLVAGRIERVMNRFIGKGGGLVGIGLGAVVTVAVASSSITTSILVPMVAAGVLALRAAYPVTLGANIGTTLTALLAALAVELPAGLVIALVHTVFNVVAIALIYPVPRIRYAPVRVAEGVADLAMRTRAVVAVYLVGVFLLIPLAGVALLR